MHPEGRSMTVEELVERYLSTRIGVKPNTKANYNFVKNLMKKEDFYYKKIGDVKTSDAKLFLIKLQQDGKRYSTVKTVRGVLRPTYPDSLRNNTGDMIDIKAFIEIAYKYWIVNSRECRYKFTIEVNDRLKIFKLPYRLQSGILIKQGYKTSFPIDKIINYLLKKLIII